MQGKGFALAFPTTLQNAPKSLPPSRGKVASAKRMTDEGAARLSPLIVKDSVPVQPPHPPPAGAPSPLRVEGFALRGTGDTA